MLWSIINSILITAGIYLSQYTVELSLSWCICKAL